MNSLKNNPDILLSDQVRFKIMISKGLAKLLSENVIDILSETNDLIFYTPQTFWMQPVYHEVSKGVRAYSVLGIHPQYDEEKLPDEQLDKLYQFIIQVKHNDT